MWFIRNITRFQLEWSALLSLIQQEGWLSNADWGVDEAKLYFNADVIIGAVAYPIHMVYPENYPANPPTVTPRSENIRWSSHQYGIGGELCLEWGPDTWLEDLTGADIIRSAYKLLFLENSPSNHDSREKVPTRHKLEIGQELRQSLFRFICNKKLSEYLNSKPIGTSGTVHFGILFSEVSLTIFVNSIQLHDNVEWENDDIPNEMRKVTTEFNGVFYVIDSDNAPKSLTVDGLQEFSCDISLLPNDKFIFCLISTRNSELHLYFKGDSQEFSSVVSINLKENSVNPRLSPEFLNISAKKVGILGLGSVGSKIASSLARSGVNSFVLVDHDIFFPENISRNELTWEDVGQHKVDAIEHKLKLISKNLEITTRKLKLSGQEATASIDTVLSLFAQCDLVIDATADPTSFNQLSSIVFQNKKAIVWIEIFAGGIGGMVARHRPGYDPDPKVMRKYLLNYLESQVAADKEITEDYGALDANRKTIIATDADVTVLAGIASQMSLDILLSREPSVFPYSMYLIGLRRGWIFNGPFHTIPLSFDEVELSKPNVELSKEDMDDALSFLEQIINKQKSA